MSKNVKKGLIIAGISLDVAVTVFLFVVAIIMLITMPKGGNYTKEEYEALCDANGPFIGYLQKNPLVYGLSCVLPLGVLLVGNIVGLILYVRKVGSKSAVELSELTEEEKAALRAELLKEMSASEPKAEEKKE